MFMRWASFLVVLGITQVVVAKDLTHRLGVGYKNQFSYEMPSLAAQYYPNSQIGLSVALGLDTQKEASKFGCMFRLHRIIFPEERMNFYMGGGIGIISNEINDESKSGFELAGFAGGEFFFTGLDSLGFTFEAGVGVVSTSDGVRFRTFGDSPIRAGIIFYF